LKHILTVTDATLMGSVPYKTRPHKQRDVNETTLSICSLIAHIFGDICKRKRIKLFNVELVIDIMR